MAHKDWGSDDFLNDFLDFDYGKPIPKEKDERAESKKANGSKGLPADQNYKIKQDNKRYGLGDESFKEYQRMRHGENRNAGQQAEKSSPALRPSGAFGMDIPEPLSKVNAGKNFGIQNTGSTSSSQAGTVKAQESVPKQAPSQIEKTERKESSKKPFFSALTDKKKRRPAEKTADTAADGEHKLFNASEMAAGALVAAKKFVTADPDAAPEEIPAASNLTDLSQGVSHSEHHFIGQEDTKPAAADRDELAELFAELGEPVNEDEGISSDESKALQQAQEDAYDRYRSNYVKNRKKRMNAGKVGAFPRWLSRLYVLALAVFIAVMVVMDILPFGMLIAFLVVLGLLSIIILTQLRRKRTGRGVRALASITAIALIALFGVGTAYAMGTLSFLDETSVENEKRVGRVTKDPFNICITGIDVRGTIDEEGRSDVNMIVTVNPETEQILLTSIPRDYEIYMPDKDNAMDKLTHTGFYSVDTTIAAEENLLDTTINYYVKVNFTTVMMFIDAIGGIDVYSEYEFYPVKRDWWKVEKGWNHMNGRQALAFARERKAFADGDNQRIKNQQAVFEAMIKKATSSRTILLSYNKILTSIKDYFRMSFSSSEMRSLVKHQIARSPEWKIYKNTIVGDNGMLNTYTGGYAYVMTQDQESIDNAKALINGVLGGHMLDKDKDDKVFVVGAEEDGENSGDGETEGE